jgi:hypothetical protein
MAWGTEIRTALPRFADTEEVPWADLHKARPGRRGAVRNRSFLRKRSLPLRWTVKLRPQPVSAINVAQPDL